MIVDIEQRFKELHNIPNLTDEEVRIELDKLSNELTPINNKWTLDLTKDHSLGDTLRAALGMISRLRIYIESDHDEEIAKRLGYSNIRVY